MPRSSPTPSFGFVLGVAGVVGWDHGAFSVAFDQRPPAISLQIVAVAAEAVTLVDSGVVGFVPFLAVVELDALHAGAVEVGALWGPPPHRDLLRDRRPPTQMRDVGDVDALGDHE